MEIKAAFKRIGSEVVITRFGRDYAEPDVRIDVQRPRVGVSQSNIEQFRIRRESYVDLRVLDIDRGDQHLLLMAKVGADRDDRFKFLCGKDESHFFAAGVPLNAKSVIDAKTLLMPQPVRELAKSLPLDERFKRYNRAFKRQGEWFFVPEEFPKGEAFNSPILKNEPIRRGRSRAHYCQFLRWTGGVSVLVHRRLAPNGLTDSEWRKRHNKLETGFDDMTGWTWMRRGAMVYAKGTITAPDHHALKLDTWHRVYQNNEVMTEAMAFLD